MNPYESWTKEKQLKYDEWMKKIQEVDFVLVDLNLYLDTHPDDRDAIAQYNQFVQQSMNLKAQFQQTFGPLYHFGCSYSPYPWVWKEAPWPWQV
ncbi:spore coat protein CotJB [Marinicrinis sediminis]|uniref:Spore coat protein CotJB n=1 Tax=Marinicrinis sediminis TaxID=1652465 RepID=A0ABW5RE23_9BACL